MDSSSLTLRYVCRVTAKELLVWFYLVSNNSSVTVMKWIKLVYKICRTSLEAVNTHFAHISYRSPPLLAPGGGKWKIPMTAWPGSRSSGPSFRGRHVSTRASAVPQGCFQTRHDHFELASEPGSVNCNYHSTSFFPLESLLLSFGKSWAQILPVKDGDLINNVPELLLHLSGEGTSAFSPSAEHVILLYFTCKSFQFQLTWQ